jgi:hypothetical protein
MEELPALKKHSFVADFSAGLIAEAIACILYVPVDVLKVRHTAITIVAKSYVIVCFTFMLQFLVYCIIQRSAFKSKCTATCPPKLQQELGPLPHSQRTTTIAVWTLFAR